MKQRVVVQLEFCCKLESKFYGYTVFVIVNIFFPSNNSDSRIVASIQGVY